MKSSETGFELPKTMRILVVDDDEISLRAVSYCLSPLGYECTAECLPREALRLYREKSFDIVITDLQMPEMNGIELLKAIRAFDEKARVVIVTAFGDLETARAAINNRAYGFLAKPLNVSEVYNLIQTIEREIHEEMSVEVDKEKLEKALIELKDVYKGLLVQLKSIDARLQK